MKVKDGEKYYTTNELSELFGTYPGFLYSALHKREGLKIERFTVYEAEPKKRKHTYYEESVINFLDEYIERQEVKHSEAEQKARKLNKIPKNCAYYNGEPLPFTVEELSQLQQLHPLVTDPRCFNLNWWPDTVPVVFNK